jgi:F-type H+-transporting ATPase subunit delta
MLHRVAACVSNPTIFVEFSGARRPFPRELQVDFDFKGLRRPVWACAGPAELPTKSTGMAGEEPIVSGMAGRYATALFELALEGNTVDAVAADLNRFDALLSESADLTRVVRSPVFTADQQSKALSAVLAAAGIGGLAEQFLLAVAANRRLFAIRDMVRHFRTLVSHHRGEITAEVRLAEQPSEAHLAAIAEALREVSGKEVKLDLRLDPALIGGLVVKLGSRMIDSSLRTKLNAIKQAMKEAG